MVRRAKGAPPDVKPVARADMALSLSAAKNQLSDALRDNADLRASAAFLKSSLAAVVRLSGGKVTVTQSDLNAVQHKVLRVDKANDAAEYVWRVSSPPEAPNAQG